MFYHKISLLEIVVLAGALLVIQFSAVSGLSLDVDETDWVNDPQWGSDGQVPVLVFLQTDQLQHEVQMAASVRGLSRAARIQQVSRKLQGYHSVSSDRIAEYLELHSTIPVKRFWIVSAFSASLTPSQIKEVEIMEGVESVAPDVAIEGIEPVEVRDVPATAASATSHIDLLGVHDLWNRGYTGAGRLVCSFDTGVEQAHPSLSSSWRGNTSALSSAWMSTANSSSTPTDVSGHGTHTMGTMVGVEGADTIGVAPGADWMTAGVIDQGRSLSGTISDILSAFQWALNPDGNPMTTEDVPDVILNSWGVPAA
ncbi:MAG: hypothetical protein DRP45_00295, partial [Candidatus Zixiibacteriota bacterium]